MQPSDINIHKLFSIEILMHPNTSSKTTHSIKTSLIKNHAIHDHAMHMLIVFPHGNYPKNIMEINPSIMRITPSIMGVTPSIMGVTSSIVSRGL
jgi:hypothetical protein